MNSFERPVGQTVSPARFEVRKYWLLAALAVWAVPGLGACRVEPPDWRFHVPGGNILLAALLPSNRVLATAAAGECWLATPGRRDGMRIPCPALTGVQAITVDESGRIYAALADGIVILDWTPPTPPFGSKMIDERMFPAAIAAGGGRIYLAGRIPGSRLPLHVLSPEGRLLRSFGDDPGPFDLYRQPRGNLLWDPALRRVVFLPFLLNEIQVYDETGKLVDSRTSHWFRPVQAGDAMGTIPFAATVLPGGDLAIQRASETSGRRVIEILDADLRTLCEVPEPGLGRLVAASPALEIFFVRNDGISRARLTGLPPDGNRGRLRPARYATPEKRGFAVPWPPKPTPSGFSKNWGSATSFASTKSIPTIFPPKP